jgi:hypothetical protein
MTKEEAVMDCHTPSPRQVGDPFVRLHQGDMVCRDDERQSPVVDVCSYSDVNLALRRDGFIIKETSDGKRERVANNVRLKRLDSFGGMLYGISAGNRIFRLNNDSFYSRKWLWDLADFPPGIVHTSATIDGEHFWIQTADTGLLYDRDLRVVDRASMNRIKRIYGNTRDIYIDIDTESHTAMLYPQQTSIPDVASAILTHDNQLRILKPSQTNMLSDIRLLNWNPVFIRRTIYPS